MRVVSVFVILCCFFLVSCENQTVYAPVHDLSMIEPIPKKGVYHVQRGDTLYSIAWRYGLDYRHLAKINDIDSPFHIERGQTIYLRVGNGFVKYKKSIIVSQHSILHREKEPTAPVSYWRWPSNGPIVRNYSETNKGINIGGHRGDPILATAAGKVVYCGNGLRSYGNLIIIKHNSLFLSAYANNQSLLVKQGDWVKTGQKIAEKGDSGSPRVMLHFEIRRGGQPVNPLSYLARK